MCARLLAAACLKHCLNCCLCISAAIRLWFLGIFHAFCAAVPCGVHLRPAFNPIVEKPPEQIYSIDFYAQMTNNSCHTFACSKPEEKKNKTKSCDWKLDCCGWCNMRLTGSLSVSLSENRHVLISLFLSFITQVFSTFYFLFHSLPDNTLTAPLSLLHRPLSPPPPLSSLSAPSKGLSVSELAKAWILPVCSLSLLSEHDKELHCQLVRLINILYGTQPDVFRKESTSHHAVAHWF